MILKHRIHPSESQTVFPIRKDTKKLMPSYIRNKAKQNKQASCISNTNRKIGMLTSDPLVQIPLSLLAITSAQGLSIWSMQEAVVIQWRFSMK